MYFRNCDSDYKCENQYSSGYKCVVCSRNTIQKQDNYQPIKVPSDVISYDSDTQFEI